MNKDDEIITDAETIDKINNIINKNKIDDLIRFLNKRQTINSSIQWLSYLFYFVQVTSVFTTSLGQAYTDNYLTWTGIGLTSINGFIYSIIQSNTKINNNLMNNIKAIKKGNYIDELNLDGVDNDKKDSISNTLGNITSVNTIDKLSFSDIKSEAKLGTDI